MMGPRFKQKQHGPGNLGQIGRILGIGSVTLLIAAPVGMAAAGGWQEIAVAAAVAFVVLVLIAARTTSFFEVLVLTAPFMFYVPLAGVLHASAADAVLPVLAGLLLMLPGQTHAGGFERFVVALLVVIMASSLGAELGSDGFDMRLGLSNIFKVLVVVAFTLVTTIATVQAGRLGLERVLRLWGWTAAALSTGSIVTQAGIASLVPDDGFRSEGFFQDPNLYAGYLLLSLAVVLLRESLGRVPESPILVYIVTAGVVTTASRSGVATLAVVLILTFFFIADRRMRLSLLPLGVGALLVASAVASQVTFGIASLERLSASSQYVGEDPRLALWERAIELWLTNPILGVGLGQYSRFSGDVYGYSQLTGDGYVAHNTFLSVLAEVGILGALLAVAGFYALFQAAWQVQGVNRQARNSLILGLLVVVLQMMTLNLQNVRYVWIFFGVVLGIRMIGQRQPASSHVREEREATSFVSRH